MIRRREDEGRVKDEREAEHHRMLEERRLRRAADEAEQGAAE